jgi:hypothetical protein
MGEGDAVLLGDLRAEAVDEHLPPLELRAVMLESSTQSQRDRSKVFLFQRTPFESP